MGRNQCDQCSAVRFDTAQCCPWSRVAAQALWPVVLSYEWRSCHWVATSPWLSPGRWADHRRAARAVAIAVLLLLARLWQGVQRRLYGVHRIRLPLKTLLPQVPAAAPETAACQGSDCGADEVKAEGAEVLSVIYQCTEFRVGDYVTYPDDHRGQIIGIDGDGDVIVRTTGGREAVWYINKCTKALSAGDRVQYPCGEVGSVMAFDEDGDLHVQKSDGSSARWFAQKSTRLLSVGDAVKYMGGDVGTVIGFDADGDVMIVTPSGRRATWFANTCV